MNKEYDVSKLKKLKNRYAGKKKAVGIDLSQGLLTTSKPEIDGSLFVALRQATKEVIDAGRVVERFL